MSSSAADAKRRRRLVGLALCVLAVYAVLGVMDSQSAAQRLQLAQDDLAEVSRKLDDIKRLQTGPKVAALQLESPAEITNRVDLARQKAGLPQASLLKTQPQEPKRIERSDFEVRSTDIDLSAASLPQIYAFCVALHDEETSTVIRDITLNEPRNGGAGGRQEKWESQLVLTQMIFSPKSR